MKIIWAYDPFKPNTNLDQLGKKIIERISNKNKDSVTAFYVASNLETEITNAFNVPEKERFSTYPKKKISEHLKSLKMDYVKTDVISSMTISLSKIIKDFVGYTKEKKTDLVVIPSNNQPFLPRLVFGSFSETFVHASECDLLVYHQKTKFDAPTKMKILYAHDFTPKGNAGLERVMEYAKKWDAKIVVVHTPMAEMKLTPEKNKEQTAKKAALVAQLIEKNKLEHEIVISKEMKVISKIVLSTAKKTKADIIAVSAQSSRLSALLGGSVTRQILRETKVPALVLKV